MPSRSSRIRWHDEPPGEESAGDTRKSSRPGSGRPGRAPLPPASVRPNSQSAAPGSLTPRAAAPLPSPLLDALGRDLTRMARERKLAGVFGRQAELRQLERILLRKAKNNPLIVGAPGVGKTALVEALALSIAEGGLPDELRDLRLVEITAAQLTAGTTLRGSFEARMQQFLEEARRLPRLVLFVDEIHTLLRAGAAEGGALDAANILKPALSRGEIRLIGATTPDEFERFLRSDPAFERRFEPLFLEEPSIPEAIEMLSQSCKAYELHHFLVILPEAFEAAVHLSAQSILDRSLPDKAFDLLDAACTLIRLPEQGQRGPREPPPVVDARAVAAALSARLGIPVEKLGGNTQVKLAGLEVFLNGRVFGQPEAMRRIASAVQKTCAGLGDPNRPRHVFAMFGSTGTGKTAAARALAEFLFDSPDALIRLDMSEYKEPHTVARLWGAPPGYIGYNDEGSFASRLRRQPFSVVLLDEFEKAHPQVHDAFLGIFDTGRFTDARGRLVDARHTFFLLTSNLFTLQEFGPADEPLPADIYDQHCEAIRQSLSALFRPEFVNRLDSIILFGPLQTPVLARIAGREIDSLNERLSRHSVALRASPEVLRWIARQSSDPASGARAVLRMVSRCVTEPVSAALIQGRLGPGQELELAIENGNLILKIVPIR